MSDDSAKKESVIDEVTHTCKLTFSAGGVEASKHLVKLLRGMADAYRVFGLDTTVATAEEAANTLELFYTETEVIIT